jgi:hypothetical protein
MFKGLYPLPLTIPVQSVRRDSKLTCKLVITVSVHKEPEDFIIFHVSTLRVLPINGTTPKSLRLIPGFSEAFHLLIAKADGLAENLKATGSLELFKCCLIENVNF